MINLGRVGIHVAVHARTWVFIQRSLPDRLREWPTGCLAPSRTGLNGREIIASGACVFCGGLAAGGGFGSAAAATSELTSRSRSAAPTPAAGPLHSRYADQSTDEISWLAIEFTAPHSTDRTADGGQLNLPSGGHRGLRSDGHDDYVV
jgi:hypothetical protein